MTRAYYNEIDPAAAHILCAMIDADVIAPGDVDTRSIKEIQPDDISAYTQCHFFAGGGLWSVAARLAGWPDDRPLWTGSCPCQPFSAAGKGLGTDDPRHLWPDFHRLIRACRPPVVMGEQVAGKAGYGWFDGVRADLAREGYVGRAVDFPACSIDAPHQRNRLYWIAIERYMADNDGVGQAPNRRDTREVSSVPATQCGAEDDASVPWRGNGAAIGRVSGARERGSLDNGFGSGLEGHTRHGDGIWRPEPRRPVAAADGAECGLSPYADSHRCDGEGLSTRPKRQCGDGIAGDHERILSDADSGRRAGRPEGAQRVAFERAASKRPLLRNGTYWSDADWIECHDGKARRAQSGIRFLVDGLPGRVDLWRVGGNAIVPEAAAEIIAAFMDAYGLPIRRAA